MNGKKFFYAKIIFAQIGAFFISSFLVREVFFGSIPVVQPEFKREVKESPKIVKEKIESVAIQLENQVSSVIKRDNRSENKETAGTSPPPWVFEPIPTKPSDIVPTEKPENTPVPQPTAETQITPTKALLPTWLREPEPTYTQPVVPTRAPTQRPLPTATQAPQKDPPATSGNGSLEQQTISLINQKRQGMGLGQLSVDSYLTAAARKHSTDMTTNVFCSHIGSDGSDPFKRVKETGFAGTVHGETIGCGHLSAQSVVDGWWESSSHKEILANTGIKKIGVGWVGNNPTAIVAY